LQIWTIRFNHIEKVSVFKRFLAEVILRKRLW